MTITAEWFELRSVWIPDAYKKFWHIEYFDTN
jgi:hypothetical protein